VLIGHSMGGKVAMVAALSHPDEVERLLVVDIAPVPYSARHLGLVHAMRALDLKAITRRGEADRALAGAISDSAERGFLLHHDRPEPAASLKAQPTMRVIFGGRCTP